MCIEPKGIVSKQEIYPPPGTMHIPTLLIDLAGCAASSAPVGLLMQYYPLHPDGFSGLDLVGARSSPHNCVFASPHKRTFRNEQRVGFEAIVSLLSAGGLPGQGFSAVELSGMGGELVLTLTGQGVAISLRTMASDPASSRG